MRTKLNRKDFVPARVNTSISPGEMLKTLRELQEMTQEQLAILVGVSKPTLNRFEQGKTTLSVENALKILAMLGLA